MVMLVNKAALKDPIMEKALNAACEGAMLYS
jgi:hypothetical protein